jgi:hypothetical protein
MIELQARVRALVAEAGVDFVDLEADFKVTARFAGPSILFSEPPCGGHFSERGYQLVADRLLEYLDLAEGRREPMPGWHLAGNRVEYRGISSPRIASALTDPRRIWQPAAIAPPPSTQGRVINHVQQIYASSPMFGALMVKPDELPMIETGASIMGQSITPGAKGNVIRVRASCEARGTDSPNSLVLALFKDGAHVAVRAAIVPIPPAGRGAIELVYEFTAPNTASMFFDVRVGAGEPGNLQLNPEPAAQRCRLAIEEIASI